MTVPPKVNPIQAKLMIRDQRLSCLHPPSEKTGIRNPLDPRRLKGICLGSKSTRTGQSCRGDMTIYFKAVADTDM